MLAVVDRGKIAARALWGSVGLDALSGFCVVAPKCSGYEADTVVA